jgi:hypothetical protein
MSKFETSEEFLWLSFITYFGNAISPYVRLDCPAEPRFFSVAIGQSGRTRKSAGINARSLPHLRRSSTLDRGVERLPKGGTPITRKRLIPLKIGARELG